MLQDLNYLKFPGIGSFISASGVYIGDWMGGAQSGNGTAVYANGNKYVGEFKEGLKHGYGVFTGVNGERFQGYFR